MTAEPVTVLYPPEAHLDDRIFELSKKASTATISGMLLRRGFRFVYMAQVVPLKRGTVVAGRAYTLRYLPHREDLSSQGPERHKYAEHVAIESLGPGDVLVVDTRGNTNAGIFGDRLVTRMQYRVAAGLVTDGAIRDTPYLRDMEFPVFVRGPHGYGHTAEHWAMDVQLPVACGNVAVFPGDLVVGDDDGVVVVPQAMAEGVIQEAIAQEEEETFTRELLEKGYSIDDVHGKLPPDLQAEYERWRQARGQSA